MEEHDSRGQVRTIHLEQSDSERDLGVQITSDLKHHDQVTRAANKANSV